jgi:hypothetical protein
LEKEHQTKALIKLLAIGKYILEEGNIEGSVGKSLPNLTYLTYTDLKEPILSICYKARTMVSMSYSHNDHNYLNNDYQ